MIWIIFANKISRQENFHAQKSNMELYPPPNPEGKKHFSCEKKIKRKYKGLKGLINAQGGLYQVKIKTKIILEN